MKRDVFSIDFETFYSTDISLKIMPTWNYTFHPEAVPYLMAIHNDNYQWVGDPKDFRDWDLLKGADLWAHNAHFDGLVWKRLERDGILPSAVEKSVTFYDTADMVAYLRLPRSLDRACAVVVPELKLEKAWRDKAKGKTVSDMKAEGWWPDMVKYGAGDAVGCTLLRNKLADQWPEPERRLSRINRESCWKGLQIDVDLTSRNKVVLDEFLWNVEKDIPWEWDRKAGETPLRVTEIRAACRKAGITCPASFAKDSLDALEWEDTYAGQYPWVRGIRFWRRAGFIRHKLYQLLNGMDEHGVYHYDLRYCGADTGRYAAGTGRREDFNRFSVHGMPKSPIYVDPKNVRFHDGALGAPKGEGADGYVRIDVRHSIRARDGHSFVIWDFAQIEPRLMHWVVGNTALLKKIKERGISVYQAEAEESYGWKGVDLKKENPQMYFYIKTEYLGGQYQMSGERLFLRAEQFGIPLKKEQAFQIIQDLRSKNPGFPALWHRLNTLIKICAVRNEDFSLELPSGRVLTYYSPKNRRKDEPSNDGYNQFETVAQFLKGDSYYKVYGGVLTNNLIQGTGRDVLCAKVLDLDDTEFHAPLWTIHDEGVNEIHDSLIPKVPELKEIVERDVPWLKGLPLASEIVVSKHYVK